MSHLAEQYISEPELNQVKGLIAYLNHAMPADGSNLAVEAVLTDSNGEHVGVVKVPEGTAAVGAGYALHYYVPDPT